MTENIDINDIEFIIDKTSGKKGMIVGVVSKSCNCSSWMIISNEKIKECGADYIMSSLQCLREALVYQYVHGMIK